MNLAQATIQLLADLARTVIMGTCVLVRRSSHSRLPSVSPPKGRGASGSSAVTLITVFALALTAFGSVGVSPAKADDVATVVAPSTPTVTAEPMPSPSSDSAETVDAEETDTDPVDDSEQPTPTDEEVPDGGALAINLESTPESDQSQPTPTAPAEESDDRSGESDVATDDTSGESNPTPTSTPIPTPTLTYAPADHPVCTPVDDLPEVIASGGSLDYLCTSSVVLTGDHLSPLAISLNWTVMATISADWSVQLLPPVDDPTSEPEWTAANRDVAEFEHQASVTDPSVADAADSFTTEQSLTFRLRVYREACQTSAPTVALDVRVAPTTQLVNAPQIERQGDQPEPYALTPSLEPITDAAPIVSIRDFMIAPIVFSLDDQVASGTVTLQVENVIHQCRDWSVAVTVQTSIGEAGSGHAIATVIGEPADAPLGIDVAPVFDSAQDLTSPVVVSVVHAGTEPGAYTQTIAFDLTIPGQTGVGLYRAHASAVVEPSEVF